MGKKELKITLGEILYWIFFGTILFAKGIGLYDGQNVFKLVLVFSTLCLFLKICIEEYTAQEIFFMILIFSLTAITYLISGEKGLLLYGLVTVGVKNVNLKRIFFVGAGVWTIAFASIIVKSLFVMDSTVYKVHDKLGLGHIFRWSLGYPHPNVLQISYLVLAIFAIYLLGNKFNLKHAILLFLGNCWVFMYSVSYTGFIVFMILLTGRIYLIYRKKWNIVEKIMIQLIFPLSVFLSLVAPITIKGKLFIFLNELLSTRMELAWRYLKPEYISLFGIRVSEITTESLTMDNAYLSAFITYGMVPFLIICFSTIYMIFRYVKEEKYLETIIIITIVIAGLTEPFLYNTSFKNLSFLFMGALLFGNKHKRKEKGIAVQKNKEITLSLEKITFFMQQIRKAVSLSAGKVIGGLAGAVLLFIIISRIIIYPAGYVVYRKDCADLTKEKHYYKETASEYADYKKMEDFEDGSEIEYFSGNIVKMERFRNTVTGIVGGYAMGYSIVVLGLQIMSRSEKNRGKNDK